MHSKINPKGLKVELFYTTKNKFSIKEVQSQKPKVKSIISSLNSKKYSQ